MLGFDKEEEACTLFFVILCNNIWKVRNTTLHDNVLPDPIRVPEVINKVFLYHSKAWNDLDNPEPEPSFWEAPLLGWVKNNFDAACRGKATIAAYVVRDPSGKIVEVHTLLQDYGSLLGEAAIAHLALIATCASKFHFVLFEGDSSVVIKAVLGDKSDVPWCIASLVVTLKLFCFFLFLLPGISPMFVDLSILSHTM